MTEVGTAIEEARTEINASAVEFMPDLCDIVASTPSLDNYGGTTATVTTTLSNVPCSYKALSERELRLADTVITDATHKIKLPSNATTQAIKVTDRIDVHARGNTPALSFHGSVMMNDAMSVFVYVAASLQKI